jgi:hypothetical protein
MKTPERRRFMRTFRMVRIGILVAILVAIVLGTWSGRQRIVGWKTPLSVNLVPINAEGDPGVEKWIQEKKPDDFGDFAAFLEREGARYAIPTTTVALVRVVKSIDEVPPAAPRNGGRLAIGWWSLKLRAWSWWQGVRHDHPEAQIQIYLLYHPPAKRALPHSLGLEKLRLGVVYTMSGQGAHDWTQIAVAHELFHTLGATDKYNGAGQPVHPEGYAEPDRVPLHPQTRCEIMSGHIAVDETRFRRARNLGECLVGSKTAAEIHWLAPGTQSVQ